MNQSSSYTTTPMDGPLPLPVVIPQQRPGSHDRGFMTAYSPYLQDCGIDQDTMHQFIQDTNTALEGNKYLTGIQIASFGAGFAPGFIAFAVTTSVQLGAGLAKKAHVKHKTNNIIDKYNEELFGPRGLHCMIMKYDPEVKDPNMPESSGAFSRIGGAFSPHSGVSNGVEQLPMATAPMVFMDDRRRHKNSPSPPPYDDEESVGERSVPVSAQKMTFKEKSRKVFDNLNDYLDRRARAQYATENPGDILNTPLNRPFKRNYLDPNHPMMQGGLKGFISGGALTPDPETRMRQKAIKIDEEERRIMDEYQQRMDSVYSQRQSEHETQRQLKYVSRDYEPRLAEVRHKRHILQNGGERHIKKDILYLMIVNKPSDHQIASAMAEVDMQQQHMQYDYKPAMVPYVKA